MHTDHAKNNISSFLYLKIFIAVVLILIGVSVFAKIYSELNNSSFKNNSFTILYLGSSTYLLNVDKKESRFTFINLGNLTPKLKGKNNLEMSLFIGAPINAIIQDKKAKSTFNNSDDFLGFSNEITLLTPNDNIVLKRLNAYDIYKFMNTARGVKRENRKNEKITNLDQVGIDKVLSDLLRDTAVHESNATVEVVNGTGINGLANVFSQMLSNGGYNVIEVRSDIAKDLVSQVRFKDKNMPVEELIQITSFEEINSNNSSTADISVFLGNDLEGRLSELYN